MHPKTLSMKPRMWPSLLLRLFVARFKLRRGLAVLSRIALAVILAFIGSMISAPTAVYAAGCVTSGPPSGTYTITVCIANPADGVTVTGVQPVMATVSTTGSPPSIQWLAFFLDGQNLLIDYVIPYSFNLPSDRFVDGSHVLAVEAQARDGFISTERASVNLIFQNGVTEPPVNNNTFTPSTGTNPPPGQPFVVMAAGDGASGETSATNVTNMIAASNPNLFLYLGDVYEKGTPTEFYNWYGTSATNTYYGRFRAITNPAVGNHEYDGAAGAAGYFDYWDNIRHYYSYEAAGWHFISLDSTTQFGQLEPGTAQYDWLVQDLNANTAVCTIAYFHHPVYSVGPQGSSPHMNTIWALLAQHGVDLVLTGHDHSYQRWVALDGAGLPDPTGITQFVVGTGGHGIQDFVRTDNRLAIGFGTSPMGFGALRLELNQAGANYQFMNTQGVAIDSGAVACSGAAPDTTPPSVPGNLHANSNTSTQVDLTWSLSTDNVGIMAYEIYRNGVFLADNGSATSHTDNTVSAGTFYQYQVRARDPAGNLSAFGNTATVTTPIGLFSDDFESNSLSRWTSATNLAVGQQEVFAGSYAARGISNGLPTNASKQLGTTQNELYYRIQFKIISQVQTMNLLKFRTAAGTSLFAIFVSNTGNLGSRNDVTPLSTFSTTPVTKGVWHELQVRVLINGSAGQAEVWLDGNGINTLSKTEALGTNPIGRLQLGENATGANFDVAYDNIAADTQFISSGINPTITPTPTGTSTSTSTPTATATPSQTATAMQTPTSTNTPTPTQTSLPTTLTFAPTADTYVQSDVPTTNFGSSTQFVTDNSPIRNMLLKFNVSGVGARTVVNAKLRLYCVDGSPFGGAFYRVANISWSEGTVNWNTAPAADISSLGTLGAVAAGNWYEVNVTSLVTGDGTFSLKVNSTSTDGAYYSTKEGTPGFAPQLILTTSTGTGPTITPTNTPTATATPSQTLTPTLSPTSTFTPTSTPTATPSQTSTSTSTPTNTATPTSTSGSGSSFTFTPTADAYVYTSNPTTNFGSLTMLRTDASPDLHSYLRFNVQGLTGTVTRATLRIFANSASTLGCDARSVSDNTWGELTINYNNAPAVGGVLGSSGRFGAGTWINIDVTAYIAGNGTYNVGLTTPSSTAVSLASRESGGNAPQLIIETSP